LDGEGSFTTHVRKSRNERKVRVSACQAQEWPLLKLRSLFGGYIMSVSARSLSPLTKKPLWRWELNGKYAAALSMTLYTLLSPRRQDQVKKLLAAWCASGRKPKTHCPQGHAFDALNTYLYLGKYRMCKQCRREKVIVIRRAA